MTSTTHPDPSAEHWLVKALRTSAARWLIGVLAIAGTAAGTAAWVQGDHGARITALETLPIRVRALEAEVSGVRSEVRLLIRWTVPRQAWPAGMEGE